MEKKANEKIKTGEYDTKEVEMAGTDWHLPVLAMTADVIQATYEECIKCGMDGYVSKPFEEKQLYQAVAKLFLPADS
jgi:arabidopsis histidine kinase 2/3/4 (cytokinin receptor)